MTEQDWIELGTTRALNCKKRIAELELLSGENFCSYYYEIIPSEGEKVDGKYYGGGLPEAYRKVTYLEEDLASFEQRIFSSNATDEKHK